MQIISVKLAQGIQGFSSNLLTAKDFDLEFDAERSILAVREKRNLKRCYLLFPTNIAYIHYTSEVVEDGQGAEAKGNRRGAKKAAEQAA